MFFYGVTCENKSILHRTGICIRHCGAGAGCRAHGKGRFRRLNGGGTGLSGLFEAFSGLGLCDVWHGGVYLSGIPSYCHGVDAAAVQGVVFVLVCDSGDIRLRAGRQHGAGLADRSRRRGVAADILCCWNAHVFDRCRPHIQNVYCARGL